MKTLTSDFTAESAYCWCTYNGYNEELESIACTIPFWCFYFVRDIKGANIRKCFSSIVNTYYGEMFIKEFPENIVIEVEDIIYKNNLDNLYHKRFPKASTAMYE